MRKEKPDLLAIENGLHAEGFALICGVDEAGRGPLAGPVCAGAVILPQGLVIEGLDDSKKLSEKKREALFPLICEKALSFSIAFSTVEEIEELNILQAAIEFSSCLRCILTSSLLLQSTSFLQSMIIVEEIFLLLIFMLIQITISQQQLLKDWLNPL